MRNALTVDVEDYFHVAAFARQIDPTTWDRFPLRVERNTHRLLDLFAERDVRATFFVLGWVAERCPRLGASDCRSGPRGGLSWLLASAHLRADPRRVPRRDGSRQGVSGGPGPASGVGLPGSQLLDHQAFAVGARYSGRAGICLRFEHLSGPS